MSRWSVEASAKALRAAEVIAGGDENNLRASTSLLEPPLSALRRSNRVTFGICVIIATQWRGFPLSADAPRVSSLAKLS
jgi:hypothetical protein